MRKVFALIAILLALGVVSYFYFKVDHQQSASKSLFQAIPKQFPIALESENWNEVFDKVDTFSYFETFELQDWLIGTQLNLNELNALNLFFQQNQLANIYAKSLVAYGNAGNSQLGIYVASRIDQNLQIKDILSAFDQSNIEYTTNSFKQQDVVTINNDPAGLLPIASFALSNQVLLYSHQASFVEDGLIALAEQQNPWDTLAQELGGEEDLRFYCNPTQLNFLTSYLLNPASASLMTQFSRISSNAVFQLDFFPELVNISGFVNRGQGTLADTLKSFQSASMWCTELLPSNTAFYQGIGIANNVEHFNADFDLKRLHTIVDESLVLFTLESYNEELSNRQGAVLALRELEYLDILKELDASIAPAAAESEMQIYSSKLGELLNKLFFTSGYFSEEVFFVKVNDLLVMSSNLAVVEQFVFAHNEGETLRTNDYYMNFKASSASKTNLDFYLNFSLMHAYLSKVSTPNTWQSLFEQISVQYANIGNLTYCNGKLGFQMPQKSGSKRLWTTNLDTTATCYPQTVINHNNGKFELLIQDDANQLYLLSSSGEVQWKIPLQGKIQSKIHQLDYYKNKKLQYVFNTLAKIYVIDRNGDLVDGFPIDLPSNASNGMCLINYDQSGKYRYLIACDNGNVYGYDKAGAPLTGWNPKRNIGQVKKPIQHVLYNGKDYIYFNNTDGDFYALNRKAENRFEPLVTKNEMNYFHFEEGQFIGGDYGVSIEVDANGGMTENVVLDSTYRIFWPANSLLQAKQAFAFTLNNTFKFQLSQWQNYCSYTTEDSIQEMESFTYKSKLWFLLKTNDHTYLIDEIGNLHPEFPLSSTHVSLVDLIPGKEKIILYPDDQGNLNAIEIGWTNL